MNRRSVVLSGLSLPWLSSAASQIKSPDEQIKAKPKINKNVVFICQDFGFLRQDLFYGKNDDCDAPYFDMLKDIKGQYTFFHSTHQPNLLNSSHGAHSAALSCVKFKQRMTYPLESVDQYIGSQSLRECRHKTVNFTTNGGGRVNWNSSAQKVPAQGNVYDFYNKMFGEVDTKVELANAKLQLQVLARAHEDILRKSSTSADKKLAASLKVKVDELKEDLFWIKQGQPENNVEIDKSLGKDDQHIRMGDALNLCVEAFKHKLTKVATIHFNGTGKVALKGVSAGYHGLSHKPRNPEALAQKKIVDEFVLKSIIDHVKALESQKMLDDTIIVVTGAMGNSASHSNYRLPVFLMGGGLKHKGVMNCMGSDKKLKISLADVYQTVVAELGLPAMNLPYCKGPVKELLS